MIAFGICDQPGDWIVTTTKCAGIIVLLQLNVNQKFKKFLIFGFIIENSGGHYDYAFILDFTMTCLGLVPLFLYRHLMRSPKLKSEAEPKSVLTVQPESSR